MAYLLFTVLAAACPNRNDSIVGFWWEPSSRFQTADLLLYPHTAAGTRELSGVSFIRALMALHLYEINHLPQTPPFNTVTLGIGFNIGILRGGTQIFRLFTEQMESERWLKKSSWRQSDNTKTKGERISQRPKNNYVCIIRDKTLLRNIFFLIELQF